MCSVIGLVTALILLPNPMWLEKQTSFNVNACYICCISSFHCFLSRCGVGRHHAKWAPKVGGSVLQARPASPSGRATVLWSRVRALANAPTSPHLPANATPAPVTRTTAVPTSPSPLTRRPCLRWVTPRVLWSVSRRPQHWKIRLQPSPLGSFSRISTCVGIVFFIYHWCLRTRTKLWFLRMRLSQCQSPLPLHRIRWISAEWDHWQRCHHITSLDSSLTSLTAASDNQCVVFRLS